MNHLIEKRTVEENEMQMRMDLVANYLHTVVEPGDALLKQAIEQLLVPKPRQEELH